MTTILGARNWESGNSMLNSVDMSTNVTASTTFKKTGAYALKLGSGITTPWARFALAGTPATPSVSAWIYMTGNFDTSGTATTHNVSFRTTDGYLIAARWNGNTHTFDAYVNNVLFKAGTVEVSQNDWFHVQFYATIADAGNITILIDGHESVNQNGDTMPGANNAVDYLYLYQGSLGVATYVDNLVWGSGGLLGDLRPYVKVPAADTAVKQWTPSTSNVNWTMEEDVPPNDTQYNTAATDGLADEFALAALNITGLICVGVVPWARARMTDGVGCSLKVGVNSGGTVSTKTSALSTTWQYYWGNVDEVDPADSAAWDQTKLNALLSRKEAVIP